MISPKIIVTGDLGRGKMLIGFAKEKLRELQLSMSRTWPDPLNEGYRVIKPYQGTVIEIWSSFNYHEITIHVQQQEGRKEEEGIDGKRFRECFCNCSFAVGYIIGPSEDTPAWPDENRRYDVAVCNLKDKYIQYPYCLPSDHLNWEAEAVNYGLESVVGMPVMIFLENNRTDAHMCCLYETMIELTQTACSPVPQVEEDPPIDPALAIPTYRIVPIFPRGSSRWSDINLPPVGRSGKKQHGLRQSS